MIIYQSLLRLICITTLLLISSHSTAHELKETNARVILRDGQVEVRMIVDVFLWKTRLQNHKAWLMGDTDQVMPTDLSNTEQGIFLTSLLEDKISIHLNHQTINLNVVPSQKFTHDHSEEIVLRAKHNINTVEQVNITFPKSLGRVYVSFVKPQYQMVPSGAAAVAVFGEASADSLPEISKKDK